MSNEVILKLLSIFFICGAISVVLIFIDSTFDWPRPRELERRNNQLKKKRDSHEQ